MSKQSYECTVLIDASFGCRVTASTPEEAAEIAQGKAAEAGAGSLCHQCSSSTEMGDQYAVVVYDEAGAEILDTDWRSERISKLESENDQLKAKLLRQEAEAGTLAERMKAAGMMTVDELLAGAPLDACHRHAGVNSLETFGQWIEMRRREYVTMHAKRTLDKREDDDLYEWVLAHSGVFGEVHINFKAAMAGHEKNG